MSFGLRDADWVDPPDPEEYDGTCTQCIDFTECPCGCGWGYCDSDTGEIYQGEDCSCPDGRYRDGCRPEPDYDRPGED